MKIGVIGFGLMGRGIAISAYRAFLENGEEPCLMLYDNFVAKERIDDYFKEVLGKLVKKEQLEIPNFSKDYKPKLVHAENLQEFSDCDLVIEAIKEDAESKRRLFAELSGILGDDCVLGSNTSSIPITQLASFYRLPQRVIGIHFMNPVPKMPLVEIIKGVQTSDSTVRVARELVDYLGKTAVECKDSPGFLVNRMLVPMVNEAIFLLHENAASKEDIDLSMKLGTNHPMGPLELADFVGLDTLLYILNILYSEFKDDKYRPCPLLVQMVRAGYFGVKSGQGFYKY